MRNLRPEGRKIQAHEEWSYDTSTNPATARINRIVLQCQMCHGCEHFFQKLVLAKKGVLADWQIEDLRKHFCTVNSVGPEYFDRHAKTAWNEWKRLSELRWRVDLRPYSEEAINVDPATDIKGLAPKSEPPWADPSDRKRRSEFLYLLTEISTRYGYWIGSTSKSQKLPLHVFEPGIRAGDYSISCIIAVGSGDTVAVRHTLSWSDDPR